MPIGTIRRLNLSFLQGIDRSVLQLIAPILLCEKSGVGVLHIDSDRGDTGISVVFTERLSQLAVLNHVWLILLMNRIC